MAVLMRASPNTDNLMAIVGHEMQVTKLNLQYLKKFVTGQQGPQSSSPSDAASESVLESALLSVSLASPPSVASLFSSSLSPNDGIGVAEARSSSGHVRLCTISRNKYVKK